MKLAGEVALITGGAGGLGYATAENIAHLGGAVCIFDRDAERAGEACEQLKADYEARAIAATGDVTSRADVQAALELTERELGPVDMLVNAAGIVTMTGFADVTEKEWDRLIDVDLTGIFIMCQIVVFSTTAISARIRTSVGMHMTTSMIRLRTTSAHPPT